MRIAHIVCTYPPYFGGMGNSAFHMAEELIRKGHEVTVYTPLIDTDPDVDTLATVRRVAPSIQYGNGGLFPTITHDLETFDVVHLHYPFFGVAGKIRRFKQDHPHIPLVTSYHMDARGTGLLGLYMKAYARWYMPKVLAASDAIIVSTKDFAEQCEARNVYASQKDRWYDIPFGVDMDTFSTYARSVALRASWKAEHIPICLFVGGMDTAHHFKGIPQLLKAFRLAISSQDMRLILVGDGNERPYFEAMAQGLGLADHVLFVGRVPAEILPSYYATADCTVLPSTSMAEAFGMVLLESYASGTPVIATDLPGVRSIATIAGKTVPVRDINALAAAMAQIGALSIAERDAIRKQIIEDYSWSSVVSRIERVYTSLLET
jgi:glycosyltransferase involved in cell wall biosynthesis